jgi:hypothetical protein
MGNLGAIHRCKGFIVISAKGGTWMSRNRDRALRVNCRNGLSRGSNGAHEACYPNGDHVVIGARNLLTTYNDRATGSLGGPLREPARSSQIVVRDCDDIETCADGFVTKVRWCEATVAGKCVYVKIAGKNPEFARSN